MYEFRLYVMGQTAKSARTAAHLRTVLADAYGEHYALDIVDLLEHPQAAEDAKILATPTLVKVWPEPMRRIIGDLREKEHILGVFGVKSGT